MREGAMNISSAIVYATPGAASAVRAAIEAVAGVEVHAADGAKLIVTIEADNDRATADIFEALGRIAGVLSVAMIYNRFEADPEGEISQA
jgi:nitrate reductase NapD